jgi:ATP-dependent DNA helicase RecG
MPPSGPRRAGDRARPERPRLSDAFARDLGELRGVGVLRARALRARGFETVADLLLAAPTRYEVAPPPGQRDDQGRETLVGSVVARRRHSALRGPGHLELVLETAAGRRRVRFYRQAYLFERHPPGSSLAVVARGGRDPAAAWAVERACVPDAEGGLGAWLERPFPRWSRIPGVPSGILARLLREAAAELATTPDPLPRELRERFGLVERSEAYRLLHDPATLEDIARARRRLAFDRLLARAAGEGSSAEPAPSPTRRACPPEVRARILRRLPFPPTPEQAAVLEDLWTGLRGPRALRRLLIGDVGSGKTLVAVGLALAVIAEGLPVLLLVPTVPLAEQHAEVIGRWLEGSRVRVVLATEGRVEERGGGANGPEFWIGTHGVLRELEAERRGFGLVVIDEQHRFGVGARLRALGREGAPHLLSMTATPIPRSLAVARAGLLEPLHLPGRPEGRGPVPAAVCTSVLALRALRETCTRGGQAYLVFPAIHGPARPSLEAALPRLFRPQGPLRGIPYEVCHSELPAPARKEALRRFRDGEVRLLLATSIVEVGLDVPRATLMVVAGADRFGLASLHQLRGRVGRGREPGRCLLVPARGVGPAARARLELLAATGDGAALAEADLRLRGPGDLLGFRQSGFLTDLDPGLVAELAGAVAGSLPLLPGIAREPYYRRLAQGLARLLIAPGDGG